jgi:hypothetical protein
MTLGLLAMLGMAVACGDDTTNKDTGTGQDTGTTPDQGVTPDMTPTPDLMQPDQAVPTKATANSGAICSQSAPCKTGEVCVAFKSGATKGMCLGKCVPDTTNPSSPINICPVKDTATQLSLCVGGHRSSTGVTGYNCLWFCEDATGSTTKTYKCPDETNYNCETVGTSQPKIKYCVPK